MGLSRSTYYDVPSVPTDDAALVTTMIAICDEFEAYGYRRVGAELRHGEVLDLLGIWRGASFASDSSNGLWRAQQRSTPWQRDYLLRSGRVKS